MLHAHKYQVKRIHCNHPAYHTVFLTTPNPHLVPEELNDSSWPIHNQMDIRPIWREASQEYKDVILNPFVDFLSISSFAFAFVLM